MHLWTRSGVWHAGYLPVTDRYFKCRFSQEKSNIGCLVDNKSRSNKLCSLYNEETTPKFLNSIIYSYNLKNA